MRRMVQTGSFSSVFFSQADDSMPFVNADLKLIHFCNKRRFNSDTPPHHFHAVYTA
jgi:hypothetical protein